MKTIINYNKRAAFNNKPLTNRMIKFWSKREFVYEIRKVDPFTDKKIIGDKPRTFFDKTHYLNVLIAKGAQKLKY